MKKINFFKWCSIVIASFILTVSLNACHLFGQDDKAAQGGSAKSEETKDKAAENPDLLVIDDFNKGRLGNNLRGHSGAWESNPSDKKQYCKASIESSDPRVKKSKHLRLDYDVDSDDTVANGYWTLLRKLDMSNYDHFEFWVRGDKNTGFTTKFKIEFKKKKPKGKEAEDIDGDPEWIKGSFIVEGVTDKWQKISIPLNILNGINDWKDMEEFVIVFKDRLCDVKTGAILLDDLSLVKTGNPGPSIYDVVERHVEKGTRGLDEVQTAQFLIKNRLDGKFPEKVIVKKELPKDDRELLKDIARDTWKFFDIFTDVKTHLPLDTIIFPKDKVLGKQTMIGDYTNVTNIGLYLICVVSAYDLGFIDKDDAVKRLGNTMNTIEKMEKYSNFPYNYYDTSTMERTSYFISFVDSGWLAIGLYVVKNAFSELSDQATKILDSMDFGFFYDEVEQHMSHGYYTNIKYPSEYNYGVFYTEPRAISYMAIGKGDVPLEHWFKMYRTFPKDYAWQQQTPINRHKKEYLGVSMLGGYYEYEGLKYVPSWGGSLFEALMPTMVLQEKELAPEGLGMNDEVHSITHAKYALEELKYPVWGMSPSSVPGDGYSEYGVKVLGSRGYKPGVVTPHVTFLALEFVPKEAIANIREMMNRYDIYGECGFYDAVTPETGEVAYKYLALDQGMILIAINNYLNNGIIRKYFAKDEINNKVRKLLEVEKFLE